jgi:TP901 family phage tail tape measure protein
MAGSRPIVVSINGDSSGLSKALKNASGKVSAFGKSVAKVGLKAGTVFAGAATAIGTKGVMAFSEFDKGLREVRTLLGDISDQEFGQMEDDLKSFQKQFGVLSEDAIGGLYNALSAGVDRNNVFSFLEQSQRLAKAGATDLGVALDGISSSVNAMGSENLSAAEAADLMFTAVKLGKTTVDEVSKSIFQMAPIAGAAGVAFGDLTASIAVLSAKGTPTATVATQMKGVISELSKESTIADKAFRDLAGKGFTDFLNEGGTFGEAIQLMADGADNAGSSILNMFGSVEAGAAALALTSDGGEAFSAALAEMDQSAGATDKAFEIMNKGLAASMDRIKANLEVLVIEIGSKLAPIAEKATKLILKGFNNLKPALKRGRELAIELATAARERLVPIFDRAREIFAIVADKVMDIYDAIYTYLAPGITELKDKIVELLELGFNKLVEIFNSIDWGSVGQSIADAFETARAKVMEFVRAIPDGFRTTLDWIKQNKDMMIVLGGALGGIVTALVGYIAVTKVAAAVTKIWNTVTAISKFLFVTHPVALFAIVLAGLIGALVAAYFRFERVNEIVHQVFDFFRDEFIPKVIELKDTAIEVFTAVKNYLEQVFWPAIKVVVDVIIDYFKFWWEQIQVFIQLVIALFKGEWKEALNLFKEMVGNTLDFVVNFFLKLPGRLLRALPPIIFALMDIAKAFAQFLLEKVARIIDKIVDFFIGLPKRLLDAGVDIARSLFDMGVDFGKTIINAIVEGLRRAGGAISSYIMSLVPDVGSIVDSIVGGAKSKAKGILGGIGGAVSGLSPFAKGGIVTRPTAALIGEAGPEAVIPLSKAGQMGGTTINLTINAGVGTDAVQVGDEIVGALTAWSRQNGALPLSVSAA